MNSSKRERSVCHCTAPSPSPASTPCQLCLANHFTPSIGLVSSKLGSNFGFQSALSLASPRLASPSSQSGGNRVDRVGSTRLGSARRDRGRLVWCLEGEGVVVIWLGWLANWLGFWTPTNTGEAQRRRANQQQPKPTNKGQTDAKAQRRPFIQPIISLSSPQF